MKTVSVVLLGSLLSLWITEARPQAVCGKREKLVDKLASEFDESLSAQGLTAAGYVLEVFVSEAGTWTMLLTTPKGVTCLDGTGEGWRDIVPVKGEAS